ncbi:hypothetical protein [Acetobacter estunensis]|uniref:hypothetical protein n=1 Tax=Acetobacter estunensis TaxID=104097 RepID=UPI001C2D7157|nr:hypothetical protein [Acetobacter estunensis]MBV1838041.1 hypothetical protein [Acetobacter estunensis]
MSDVAPQTELTAGEKVDIRRYCWYPLLGNGHGFGFFCDYSNRCSIEYRMNTLSFEEINVVRRMLTTLMSLETGPAASASNLDTDKASVWTHNKDEVAQRIGLFNQQRFELVRFLGVRPGPAWQSTDIRLVV